MKNLNKQFVNAIFENCDLILIIYQFLQIRHLIFQLIHQRISFNLCQFLHVNKKLTFSIIGAATIYSTVLLQFSVDSQELFDATYSFQINASSS